MPSTLVIDALTFSTPRMCCLLSWPTCSIPEVTPTPLALRIAVVVPVDNPCRYLTDLPCVLLQTSCLLPPGGLTVR